MIHVSINQINSSKYSRPSDILSKPLSKFYFIPTRTSQLNSLSFKVFSNAQDKHVEITWTIRNATLLLFERNSRQKRPLAPLMGQQHTGQFAAPECLARQSVGATLLLPRRPAQDPPVGMLCRPHKLAINRSYYCSICWECRVIS